MKLYQWYTKMWSKSKQQIQTVINNSTIKAKITYRASGGEDFKAYCDADWGNGQE